MDYNKDQVDNMMLAMENVQVTTIDEQLIQRVRDRIVEASHPQAIFLFGSAARGEAHTDSDLDLLVVMDLPEGVTTHQKVVDLRDLFRDWRLPMDLIVKTPEQFDRGQRLPGFISRTARREGRLLYGNQQLIEGPMPDPNTEEAARLWLQKSESDARMAKILLDADPPEPSGAAFHSQQAAEKALKGFIAYQGDDPPRTHEIDKLLDLVVAYDAGFEAFREAAKAMEPYAVDIRYPQGAPVPDEEEAAELLSHAEKMYEAVDASLFSGQ